MRQFPNNLIWDRNGLGALLEAVARAAGLDVKAVQIPAAPAAEAAFEDWMHNAGAHLGFDTERISLRGGQLEAQIQAAAPGLLRTPRGYVGVVRIRRGSALVIARDLSTKSVRLAELVRELRTSLEVPHQETLKAFAGECGLEGAAAERAVQALLHERLKNVDAGALWQLRTPQHAGFLRHLRESHVVSRFSVLLLSHAIEYSLWLAAWWIVGESALQGRLDQGATFAWILLLITIIPLRMLSTWTQGWLSVTCGGLLRQRLLEGALKLDASAIRQEGAGRLLGKTFEAETVESLALAGGVAGALALIEAGFAAAVMVSGAGGVLQAGMFLLWLGVAGWLSLRLYRRRSRWTEQRLAMTHDLVEKMTGYRTRLAQQAEADWHAGEDQALNEYLAASTAMDRETARLAGWLPRAWLIAGIAAIAPAFLAPKPQAAALAVALGGALLASRALHRLTSGAAQLSGAWIAWKQIQPLLEAANVRESAGAFVTPSAEDSLIDARELVFRHAGRSEPVLESVNFTVQTGDWILLEGPSGGGKSTLGALLAGLRDPSSGLLLAGGLDRRTLGARAWRRLVAAAPQYHENHVFTGTFAFNLLMGRSWPPTWEDLGEAAAVCEELGLNSLLARMPGGMDQMVGETGWQLSQGERSRLFLARAILQQSRMVILDESFAALDPENLRQSLECALRRSKTLMLVAHP